MTKSLKTSVSFAAMAVLIFIGSHFFLYSAVSTGPHLDLSLGWLDLHRYGDVWSVDDFRATFSSAQFSFRFS
jgi:hypothetical protein